MTTIYEEHIKFMHGFKTILSKEERVLFIIKTLRYIWFSLIGLTFIIGILTGYVLRGML